LQEAQTVAISAIAGMGGVGKTELALQYALAKLKKEQYKGGICWLNARTGDVGTQIVIFAITYLKLQLPNGLELPDQVAYCWRFWHTSPTLLIKEGDSGQVLVVLDDVTKYEDVKRYLPTDPRFKVLMTTRLQLGKPIKRLDLEVLTEGAALAMLRSYIGERVDNELEAAKKLCEWLGYLPLGLELVGRYLERKPDLSLQEMLARLQAKRLEQLALKKTEATMTAKSGVRAAFELSWQELDQPAQQLCRCLSLFALAPIPWQLVELCLPDIDSEELEETRDDGLINLHLIKRKAANTYELHQLIREFFIDKRESAEAEQLKRGFCQAMVTVAKKIPSAPIQSEIADFAPNIPHLAEAATTQIDCVSDKDLILPFVGLARFYHSQGDYSEAEPWFEQCLSLTKARLGENHRDVATSLNNLAELYKYQGRYTEAEPLYLQALELFQCNLGENHRDVATSLNNLAYFYYSQGRYTEAEPLCLQALEWFQHNLGENHPYVANSLNNLAELYDSQGRYTEAEPLYLQALEWFQHNLGENHPYVATSLNNLAALYHSQRRYTEAEPLYLQALNLRERVLGKNHPYVATSLNNLAALYYSQGRYEQAEPLYLQALELRQRKLGENHPDVANSLNNLALLYYAQGRYEQAEPLYLQALELRKRKLGEDHPDVAASLNNLAGLYNAQGRYKQAEPFLVQALKLCERELGKNHPNTVTFRKNLQILRDSQAE
jgi:tetratricopeptide (TPR) repeat protein